MLITLGIEQFQNVQLGVPSLLVQSYSQGMKTNVDLHSYMQVCLSLSAALPPKQKRKEESEN